MAARVPLTARDLIVKLSRSARLFLAAYIFLGICVLPLSIGTWECRNAARFVAYLVISVSASMLKVRLPGVRGTMSVNFLFVLISISELSVGETLVISALAVTVQCYWAAKVRPKLIQVAFNVASLCAAVVLAYRALNVDFLKAQGLQLPMMLTIAACVFFIANTFPVSCIISLTEQKPLRNAWKQCYFWSFPYYLLGAALATVFHYVAAIVGWEIALLLLPVIYIMYQAYRLYLGRLEDEKRHAENVASLHLRTIEALALAIDAKDQNTHDHLCRVQTYAVEIAKELGLPEEQVQAVRAASLLHDIGKLAVPEHIISKPGKLTSEEFEKMKVHPVVGAEILDRVQFPYPVAPIVRHHHEKWNGEGYPDGLRGDEIPMGARILAMVDCLDALASDRQYRPALPLEEAMKVVVSESGRSFDPKLVQLLQRRYKELEAKARRQPQQLSSLSSVSARIERGQAPAAGFEESKHDSNSAGDFISSIAAARQEAQTVFELSQDLVNSLSLNETLSMFVARLIRLVPFDAATIYVRKGDRLIPEFVNGDDFRLFSSLEIPMGVGISGWVAENRKAILNGNPAVECMYTKEPGRTTTLHSALAVPLEGVDRVVGVLALYRREADAFSKDHLRVLLALASKLGLSIENALRYREAQSSATTDYLTKLPNARSLFVHLDSELARAQRRNESVAVLVCDLDGFKQVNDRFGHLEGNRVLQAVAAGLQRCCREYDYVARMGGDEFVLVLPGIAAAHLSSKVQELEQIVETAGRTVCPDASIGASIGAGFFPEDGCDAEALLATADRRMYKTKQSHKSRQRPLELLQYQPVSSTIQ